MLEGEACVKVFGQCRGLRGAGREQQQKGQRTDHRLSTSCPSEISIRS